MKKINNIKKLILIVIAILSFVEFIYSQNFIYDNLNRLKQIDYGNGTVIEYTYDAVGNRQTHIITVTQQTHNISGNVTYFSTNNSVKNTNVQLTGGFTDIKITNESGYYEFVSLQKDLNYTVTPNKTGDISTSSIIMYDASLAAQIAVSLITNPSADQKTAADVDKNGTVLMYDASLIAQYAVGLAPNPNSHVGEWVFVPNSRSYTPLTSDQTNQNYTAILLGDVDGNWTTTSVLAKVNEEKELYSALPELWELHGEKVVLPIVAEQDEKIYSCDITLRYNPAVLKFFELRTTELSKKFQTIVNNLEEGKVRLGCFGTQAINERGVYLEIVFEVIGNDGDFSQIEMESYRINAEAERYGSTSFIVGVNPNEIPENYALHQNYPNPFNPETIIYYELANSTPQRTIIHIYNIKGELVKTLIDKIQSGGRYSIIWKGDDKNGFQVASGLYIVHLKTGDYIKSKKMAKLK